MEARGWRKASDPSSWAAVASCVNRSDECSRDGNDGCSYTTLRKSVCSLEKDESGKPVHVCEKTEQLLRRCAGRPQEVVESKVEKTIEDAANSGAFLPGKDGRADDEYQQSYRESYAQGGRSSEFPFRALFERSGPKFSGAFEDLVQAAEDMVHDVFGPLGLADDSPAGQAGSGSGAGAGAGAHQRDEKPSGWFGERFFGGNPREWATNQPNSQHQQQQHQKQQKAADYSGLGRGIQEV